MKKTFKKTPKDKIDPLYIPAKGEREPGFQVFCKKCRRWITNDMSTCDHPDQQQYKMIMHIPGTETKTKSKVLPTRDYIEAVTLAREYKRELQGNNFHEFSARSKDPDYNLGANMKDYLDYLKQDGKYKRKSHKVRDRDYITFVKNMFLRLAESLRQQGYCFETVTVYQIQDAQIDHYLDYIENMNYAQETYNKHIKYMRTFYNYLDRTVGIKIRNPFNSYPLLPVHYNPKAIDKKTFIALIDSISIEGSIKKYYSKSLKKPIIKNLYRPWLADSFFLCLYTGRRQDEIVTMKFSDIITDEQGEPVAIECTDLKVERAKSEIRAKIYAPIGPEFKELLYRLGWNEYKETNRYLIAHNEKMGREAIKDTMSKAFTHYMKQIDPDSKITLKSLRKTFSTAAEKYTNGHGEILTGQTKTILNNNYLDKKEIAVYAARGGFNVFD